MSPVAARWRLRLRQIVSSPGRCHPKTLEGLRLASARAHHPGSAFRGAGKSARVCAERVLAEAGLGLAQSGRNTSPRLCSRELPCGPATGRRPSTRERPARLQDSACHRSIRALAERPPRPRRHSLSRPPSQSGYRAEQPVHRAVRASFGVPTPTDVWSAAGAHQKRNEGARPDFGGRA